MRPFLKLLLCACGACLLFGPLPADAAAPSAKLKDLFTLDMLEVTIPYFENKYGPAKYHYDDVRVYDIDGCTVTAYGKDDIGALKLDVSPTCSFDLDVFARADKPMPVDQLTFGQFENAVGENDNKYTSDCLHLCGNATVPSVYLRYYGPRALNYIEIELEVTQVGADAVEAAQTWANAMMKAEGEDYLIDARFNKDARYNGVARQAFKNVRVTAVTVGYDIPGDD